MIFLFIIKSKLLTHIFFVIFHSVIEHISRYTEDIWSILHVNALIINIDHLIMNLYF